MKAIITFSLFLLFGFVFSQDAIKVYNKISPLTVTIETDIGLGSGFFVKNNIIVTNYHVVKNAKKILYTMNKEKIQYEITEFIDVDILSDLILLKVKESRENFENFTFSDNFKIGETIFAIGSPKGLPATISDGIISGIRDDGNKNLIQISAPISPGSSGGPIVNINGELVGVAVGGIENGQNLNFAIPVKNLQKLLKNLKNSQNEDEKKITLDSDSDGIIDKDDICPSIKGTLDYNGCPKTTVDLKNILDYEIIFFKSKDISISMYNKPSLDILINNLKENSELKLFMEVRTDNIESTNPNKLANQRANILQEYFIKNGINKNRIKIILLGKNNPLVPNNSKANNAYNRSILFGLYKT